ncbi:hypothetical protein KM915_06645 [Cytobacillus oceanisediminis]|uniref:DUF6063 family protein n=1 Tax=Cytobacillus oceanisediminis TaxID=665099 RepID=UPI001C218544|nr:DUF6063 family protein [Cytobacillus oceanisediminis]MBU8729732.1 hypothetical protein [Cytobacillus oceanisediminis]
MNPSDALKAASKLYFALLKKGVLRNNDELVLPYMDHQEVRDFIKIQAQMSGVRIVKKDKYIHMLAKPGGGVFSTNLSDIRKNVKGYETKVDLYLMGTIWMVLFSEADSEMATSIAWENEGISYQKLEELTSKVLHKWKEIDKSKDGSFSREWSLAVTEMFNKWNVLHYSRQRSNQTIYSKGTKLGLIDAAMRELERDKMVFLRQLSNTTIVTPTDVFYERLQIRFGSLSQYQSRYEMIKNLIDDIKSSDEVGA